MKRKVQSNYSNELHQLLVSVSRHLYIKEDGLIGYREKPFNVNIKNYHRSPAEHLLYYIMRDHYSGNLIFSVATSHKPLPLIDFLYHAWRAKSEKIFLWGLPEKISVPKNISSPELLSGLNKLGVEPFHPPSGFASGVHSIRFLEDKLNYHLGRTAVGDLPSLLGREKLIYEDVLDLYRENNKAVPWRNALKGDHPRSVPAFSDFLDVFAEGGKFPLPWKGDGKKPQVSIEGKRALPDWKEVSFCEEKLEEAEEILDQAHREVFRGPRLDNIHKALQVSPYCSRAYLLLAGESESHKERKDLFLRAIAVRTEALGKEYFRETRREFWDDLESRDYLRGLYGLAQCYYEEEKIGEAAVILEYLLKLDERDNLGARYLLVNAFLYEEDKKEAERLLNEYEELSAHMLYARVLLQLQKGNLKQAEELLEEALQANKRVPARLLHLRRTIFTDLRIRRFFWGTSEEALECANTAINAWKNTRGALSWLREQVARRNLEQVY